MRLASIVVLCLACLPTHALAQSPSFTPTSIPSVRGARGVVSADLNGDGWMDLATANGGRDTVTVLLNRGAAGGFHPPNEIPVGDGPFDIDAGDFDRDGNVDLMVTTPDELQITILLMTTAGAVRSRIVFPAGGDSRGARLADVTGDGWLDLVYSVFSRNSVFIVPNNREGGFFSDFGELPTGTGPQGVTVADFDHNGKMDVAVANTGSRWITFLLGHGDANSLDFTPWNLHTDRALNVITTADLNRDGWTDLAAAATGSDRLLLYPNGPHGWSSLSTFATGSSPRGIATADVNQDGRLDVLVANRGGNSVSMFLGRAAGFGVEAARHVAAGAGARTVAAADFDNDGLIDIASGNEFAASVTVLDNDTALVPPAFSFRLEGVGEETCCYASEPPTVADFNENGRPDLVILDDLRVLLDGTTSVLMPVRPLSSATVAQAADMNRDGHLDVVLAIRWFDSSTRSDWNGVEVYAGNGRGGFAFLSRVFIGAPLGDLELADVDRDGLTDAVLVDFSHRLITVRQTTGDAYTVQYSELPTSSIVYELALADLNRDGILDAVSSNYYPAGRVMVSLGNGEGFGAATVYEISRGVRDLIPADMDHDGRLDLVLVSFGAMAVMHGNGDGSFALGPWSGQSIWAANGVVADFTQDGHLDVFDSGNLFRGHGDGTFADPKRFEIPAIVAVADWNQDGLPDLVFSSGVFLNERRAVNRPPVLTAHDRGLQYAGQWGDEEPYLSAYGSFDPDLHALTYEWRDETGKVFAVTDYPEAFYQARLPGTYRYTVVANDGRGLVASDEIVLTITSSPEIVAHASWSWSDEGWTNVEDETAASFQRIHYPNKNAEKVNAPLANPAHYRDVFFVADPTQTYKLWVRLKADNNSYANDSIWVQFSGAVDVNGRPVGRTGTTEGLAVNLEECSGCGVSGWGWEDDSWGAQNRNGMLLRFPEGGGQIVRIQVREDGVSVDQIVLSAEKYLTTRPGTAKNDTTILDSTEAP